MSIERSRINAPRTTPTNKKYQGLLIAGCLVFVILWSSGWIGSKYGQGYAGVFTLLVYRYSIVVFLLFIAVTLTRSWRRLSGSELTVHAGVGLLSHGVYLGLCNSAFQMGVSTGVVALITALLPMITSCLSSSVSGEVANRRQWLGLFVGLVAVMIVIADKILLGGAPVAYLLPFVGIFAFSVATLLDRRFSIKSKRRRKISTPLPLVCLIHCGSALGLFIPIAAVTEQFSMNWGYELAFSVLWLAIVVSIGAYGMMFLMLRHLSAIKVASLEYLAPPTTMLIAYFMFNERLSLIDFCGLVLAGIGVYLVLSAREGNANKARQLSVSRRLKDACSSQSTHTPWVMYLGKIDIHLGNPDTTRR